MNRRSFLRALAGVIPAAAAAPILMKSCDQPAIPQLATPPPKVPVVKARVVEAYDPLHDRKLIRFDVIRDFEHAQAFEDPPGAAFCQAFDVKPGEWKAIAIAA